MIGYREAFLLDTDWLSFSSLSLNSKRNLSMAFIQQTC